MFGYMPFIKRKWKENGISYVKQKRSTEGCSKFKSPQTSSGEIGLDIRTHAKIRLPAASIQLLSRWHDCIK